MLKVPHGLRVVVTDRNGRPLRVPGLAAWLARAAPGTARGEVAVGIVSDQHIRTLNRTYRGKDTPTDVLSFPSSHPEHPEQPPSRSALRRPGPEHLGDLVISAQTARRQAREAGHTYATELKVLALHGLLHLLGYDHDAASDRGRMARLERRLRAIGGLREGLMERASRASEPRDRSEPAKRRARARVRESEGRSPSDGR